MLAELICQLQHTHFLELGVIRTFEFVSSLRRMSVVVKRLRGSSMEVYVKGAPEVMGEICDRDSCTLSWILAQPIPLTHCTQSRKTTMTSYHTTQSEGIVSLPWQGRAWKVSHGSKLSA